MGGRPVYLTTTMLLAPGTTEEELERIFADIADACSKNGLLWVGGHTEVTPAVVRTVVCGQAVGFLSGPPLSTGGAHPGDSLCMTKWAGLEGSTTIAREQPEVSRTVLGDAGYRAVLGWLDDPGISIVPEGRSLEGLALTSGHDPTEGGVAMGIHEICRASGVGAVDSTRKPFRPGGDPPDLPPLRHGSPGPAELRGVPVHGRARRSPGEACRRLEDAKIPAAVIGEYDGAGQRGVAGEENKRARPRWSFPSRTRSSIRLPSSTPRSSLR